MKTMVQRLWFGIVLLGLVAGCAQAGGSAPTLPSHAERPRATAPMSTLHADEPRVTAPNVPPEDRTALVEGNTAFAFDLYHALQQTGDGNVFYSPYSISSALAMTYAGARGETAQQMAATLHFTLPQERLHPAFNALDLALTSRGQGAQGQGFRLHLVNALWGQQGYAFRPEYLDTLAQNYGAGLRLVDFAHDPEAARATINDWVRQQTEGRIAHLLPPGSIDTLTRLALTNAVYFKAAWAAPFEKQRTTEGPFHLLDGGQVTVPLMHQTASLGYAAGEGFQAVELPYAGHELTMVILLPAPGQFERFEETLNAERVQAILPRLNYRQVELTLPRFRLESSYDLKAPLAALGMPAAFDPAQADFSGMDGKRDLYIGAALHKAFVSVDEAGTEAAAATAATMEQLAMPTQPVKVTVDRPFIFFIRDRQTGAILFLGRMVRPAP